MSFNRWKDTIINAAVTVSCATGTAVGATMLGRDFKKSATFTAVGVSLFAKAIIPNQDPPPEPNSWKLLLGAMAELSYIDAVGSQLGFLGYELFLYFTSSTFNSTLDIDNLTKEWVDFTENTVMGIPVAMATNLGIVVLCASLINCAAAYQSHTPDAPRLR